MLGLGLILTGWVCCGRSCLTGWDGCWGSCLTSWAGGLATWAGLEGSSLAGKKEKLGLFPDDPPRFLGASTGLGAGGLVTAALEGLTGLLVGVMGLLVGKADNRDSAVGLGCLVGVGCLVGIVGSKTGRVGRVGRTGSLEDGLGWLGLA